MTSYSRRNLLFCLTGIAAAVPLSASAAKKENASPDPNLRLGNVGVPVIANGAVINYVFVSVQLKFTPKADTLVMKGKEPFFRDRIVHVAHRVDFAEQGRTDRLDEAKFKKVMLAELSGIAGKGMIASIEILMQNPKSRQKRHLPQNAG